MLSELKHEGECPECGKAYRKPPSGTVRVVCRSCEVVFDGKKCRQIEDLLEETQRSRFGV